ncbi:MAG: acyltransferase [Chitinophagaceae bacterium]|nr:acyltransferase [Chitinophagaceae bacterium]
MSVFQKIGSECNAWLDNIVFAWPGLLGNRLRASRLAASGGTVGKQCYVERSVFFRGARNISFGSQVSVGQRSYFFADKGRITVGNRTAFNTNNHINASMGGTITIGDNCLIGPNVVMHSANHRFTEKERPIRDQGHEVADITLGDNVWIGANVTILAGVSIGAGAVVAAGAVVNDDVQPFTVVGGVPAKIIKER